MRQAIAKAYPFDAIHKASGDTSHSFTPTSTLIPPQIPGRLDFTVDGMNGTGQR